MGKYSASSAASGALTGAATGATLGSVVPGIGTAIGGIGGAIIGGLSGLFGSKKKKKKKVSTLDPQQRALYNDYVSSLRGQGPNAGLFNYDANAANQDFELNVARPAYRQFQENVIPSITGQFRSNNIGNSSYTGEALSRHGRDIQESLNAARSRMHTEGQNQANQNKINGLNTILGTNTFDYRMPKQNSLDNILGQAAPAAGEYIMDWLKSERKTNASPTQAPSPVASPAI